MEKVSMEAMRRGAAHAAVGNARHDRIVRDHDDRRP